MYLVCRIIGLSDYQTVGLLDRRTIGVSDYRSDPHGSFPCPHAAVLSWFTVCSPLSHFNLLFKNQWANLNQIWQE